MPRPIRSAKSEERRANGGEAAPVADLPGQTVLFEAGAAPAGNRAAGGSEKNGAKFSKRSRGVKKSSKLKREQPAAETAVASPSPVSAGTRRPRLLVTTRARWVKALLRIDALKQKLGPQYEALKREGAELAAEIRRAGYRRVLLRKGRIVLAHSGEQGSIDEHRFLTEGWKADIKPAVLKSLVKHTVPIEEARDRLGRDFIDPLIDWAPGSPYLSFHSSREAEGDGTIEECEPWRKGRSG